MSTLLSFSHPQQQDKHGLQLRWPSVEQKHTLPLKSLLYPRRTKRRVHLRTVPTIRPWPGPFFLVSSSLPPAHTPTGSFQHGVMGCEVRPLCSHVSMLVYSVRLAPCTIDVQRDWPAAFDVATPTQIWMSMGGKTHLHLYVCKFTVNAKKVWNHYLWSRLKLD